MLKNDWRTTIICDIDTLRKQFSYFICITKHNFCKYRRKENITLIYYSMERGYKFFKARLRIFVAVRIVSYVGGGGGGGGGVSKCG